MIQGQGIYINFPDIKNKLLDDSGIYIYNGIYINFPDIKNKLLDDSGTMGFILTFQI